MRFEVSPAGCFSWLYTLCFTVFFNSVFLVMLMRAGLPYMGMPAHAHNAVPAPSTALLRHHCALFSASQTTVSTLFEMAPKKGFFSGE